AQVCPAGSVTYKLYSLVLRTAEGCVIPAHSSQDPVRQLAVYDKFRFLAWIPWNATDLEPELS
ncbi:hypothetical protein AK812_SmicGene1457, partial [Symbiodinium microadriaticum]